MKILLTTLNSKHIHSNLALKYLYAVSADAVKEPSWNSGIHRQSFDDYIYGNCSGANTI